MSLRTDVNIEKSPFFDFATLPTTAARPLSAVDNKFPGGPPLSVPRVPAQMKRRSSNFPHELTKMRSFDGLIPPASIQNTF